MEKLPSRNVEKLLMRIRDSENGKLSLASLNDDDWNRFKILQERKLVQGCDPAYFKNDPDSEVVFVGPNYQSAMLSTLGKDYLDELSQERADSWKRFGRDVVMLILGAIITIIVTIAADKFSTFRDSENPIPVSQNSPTPGTELFDGDLVLDE